MKKSIKNLVAFAILFIVTCTSNAQADEWSGRWNTKFGEVVITKNGDTYTGFFPKGKLTEVREQEGVLIGRYTRLVRTSKKSSLGNKGEFRFILSADKTKFDGFHKSETDTKWGSENWNGKRVY